MAPSAHGAGKAQGPKSEEERAAMLRAVCRDFIRKSGPVDEWTPAKVSHFLSTCTEKSLLGSSERASGLSVADTFRKHGVRGRQLLLFDTFTGNQQLKAPPFSIASLGQRMKLLDAIKVLVEEEVEARVSADAATAKGSRHEEKYEGVSEGGVGKMLGRTFTARLRGMASQDEVLATLPAWRSSAFPPSGWMDPGDAGRMPPSTELELEFVFGYSGSRARGNLCCNDAGELIFPVSHIAVVFNIETRTQRFFLEHTEEVSALAMHPDNVLVATGDHCPAGTICVWDSQSMETLAILSISNTSSTFVGVAGANQGSDAGVCGLSFSGTSDTNQRGLLLSAVGRDMSVVIWRWKDKQIHARAHGGTGRVYDLRANPYKEDKDFTLVTAGTQSVRFWTIKSMSNAAASEEKGLFGVYGSFGNFGTQQAAVCIEFLDAKTSVTGMQDGSIYIWNGIAVCKALEPAHGGPIFDLAVADDYLLSASHDGKVHQWSLSKLSTARDRTVLTLLGTVDTDELCRKMDAAHDISLDAPQQGGKENASGTQQRERAGEKSRGAPYSYWDRRTPCVRALTILPKDEGNDRRGARGTGQHNIAIGMETNSIFLLKCGSPTFGREIECLSLLNAHAQDKVTALCAHSERGLLASIGTDGTLRVWDLRSKRMIAQQRLWERTAKGDVRGLQAVCMAFSSDESAHLCAGLTNGHCKIFSCRARIGLCADLAPERHGAQKTSVSVCRYAPQDHVLAVGATDNTISLYSRTESHYDKIRVISVSLGGWLIHVDFSIDSKFLQGETNLHDLIYWEVEHTGQQIRNVALMRDARWHNPSCCVGWSLGGLHPDPDSNTYQVTAVQTVGNDLVLAGTTWGEIKVSRFPSLDETRLKSIRAHSAAVSALCVVSTGAAGRWQNDRLFSAGGEDLSIFCWRMCKQQMQLDEDLSSSLNPQRVDDVHLLSSQLPSPDADQGAAVAAAVERGAEAEPWHKNMLRIPLQGETSTDVIGGWGSSFARIALKDLEMQLMRVHGYRGFDCRHNVLASSDGLVIWFVGRVVVLSSGADDRQKYYFGHTNDVACIAKCESTDAQVGAGEIPGNGQDAAGGGGEDPLIMASAEAGSDGMVHIWEYPSLKQQASLTHGFPVRLLSFGPRYTSILVSVGGREYAHTLTVWNWSKRDAPQLAHMACVHNVPFLDVCVNPWAEETEDEQTWAATCGPHGVTFWTLHEDAAGRYTLSTEEGAVHHPVQASDETDHMRDPMAICAHFVSGQVLVTGMANGDLVVWHKIGTTNRIRLAHPGGVFDLGSHASVLVSGGQDCTIRTWDINVFKGRSQPQSRSIACKVLVQNRAACVRSVCCGAGPRRGKVYAGLASNDLLEISTHDFADSRRLVQGHAPRHMDRIASREWLFTIHNARSSAESYLRQLQASSATNFLLYCHRRSDPAYLRAHEKSLSAGQPNGGASYIAAWHHASTMAADSAPTRIQGFVQFKSFMSKEHVRELLPGASVELAVRDKIKGFSEHVQVLHSEGLGARVQVGVLDTGETNHAAQMLAEWPLVSLSAHPDGTMGASVGRDGTVRVWQLPLKASAGSSQAQVLAQLTDLYEELLCVAWSPDGSALAVGSSKGSLYLLNAHDLAVRTSQTSSDSSAAAGMTATTAVSFRPDGEHLASACFTVRRPPERGQGKSGAASAELEVAVSITFVSGKRHGVGVRGRSGLEPIEKGLLPPHKARGVPVSLDWSADGCYVQVCTSEREVLYWSVKHPRSALVRDKDDAWHTFEQDILAAAMSRPGHGWRTWRGPFGHELDLAYKGTNHATIAAERNGFGPMFATGDVTGSVAIVSYHQGGVGDSETAPELLRGQGKHGGGVACVAFARDVEHHRMHLLSTGSRDLAVYEWLLKPSVSFLKKRRDRAALRIQARQRGIQQRKSKILEQKRGQLAAAEEESPALEEAPEESPETKARNAAGDGGEEERDDAWSKDVEMMKEYSHALVRVLPAASQEGSLQEALRALLQAQANVLELLKEEGKGGADVDDGEEEEREDK